MSTRPEVERALIRGGGTPSEGEAQRFYAERVSAYAFVLALIFGGIYLFGFVVALAVLPGGVIGVHLHPAKLVHLGTALGAVFVWRFARRPHCPTWFVTGSDVLLPVVMTLAVLLVSRTVPQLNGVFAIPLLIGALLLTLRAALVPSVPLRTAVVGVASSVSIVGAAYWLSVNDPKPPIAPALIGAGAAVWCAALVAATTIVSQAIYGLRREVASAKRLGQYVLGELIGEGGMGAVYRAEHAMLRRPTAVKVLSPERAGRDNLARFEREVKLTAKLTHPNTVAVYDYGRTPDGLFYYAMEYLDGLSLEELVRRFGPQPPGRVIHILLQAAGALCEAHGLGLIHRDVKPANMLFCERGGAPDSVKLLDFGLVKQIEPDADPGLTHADAITGTPQYLAPESITNPAGVDHRVDLYALGAVGFFLLTGRPPFEGKSVLEVCGHHLHTRAEAPSAHSAFDVPAALDRLVLACLAKDPSERPASAGELLDALVACGKETPWPLSEARAFWQAFRDGSGKPPIADSAA